MRQLVILLILGLFLQPALAKSAPLSGGWVDNETGDFYIDFNKMTYSGVDDSCKILKITEKKNRISLYLRCFSDADTDSKGSRVVEHLRRVGKKLFLVMEPNSELELIPDPKTNESTNGAVSPSKKKMPDYAIESWNELKGEGAVEIFDYARHKEIECDEEQPPCYLANHVSDINFFVDPPSAAPTVGIARLAYPTGGSSVAFEIAIFEKKTQDGKFAYQRNVTGLVGDIDEAKLDPKDVTNFIVVTETMLENDSRCCPSGRTIWAVPISTGVAKFVGGDKPPN